MTPNRHIFKNVFIALFQLVFSVLVDKITIYVERLWQQNPEFTKTGMEDWSMDRKKARIKRA